MLLLLIRVDGRRYDGSAYEWDEDEEAPVNKGFAPRSIYGANNPYQEAEEEKMKPKVVKRPKQKGGKKKKKGQKKSGVKNKGAGEKEL